MTLMKCPACGHDVSEQATSCPNCGQPLHVSQAPIITKPTEDSVQTIQLTKKKWKKLRLWGLAFLVIGIIFMFNHLWPIGVLLWIIAFIVGITANVGAWWSTG